MCVIIYKPQSVIAGRKLLEIRHKSNSDSWGFATRYNIQNGKTDFESFWNNFELFQNKEILIHFRTGTSGIEKDKGIQPIMSNGLAIFHNGNFPEYFGKKQTDTVLWAKDNPDPLNHLKEIEKYCEGNGSKMAFMDNMGKVYLINEKAGVWEEGMWFSNPRIGDYSGFGFSGLYKYKEGEKRYF